MTAKLFATVFVTVFLAELGDKTQLATLLYASKGGTSRLTIFLAASSALILTSGLGVLAGAGLSAWVNPRYLAWAAGAGFILVGVWTILKA